MVAASPPKKRISKSKSLAAASALSHRVQELFARKVDFIPSQTFRRHERFRTTTDPTISAIESGEVVPAFARASSGLPAHLARMCATPLLSSEQEQLVFERMNYCKYWANRLRSALDPTCPDLALTMEVEELLERADRLRNYIIQANTRLVMSIARKFADHRNLFDDLLSQGIAALIHSIEKFDFERGYRFSTYATCAVRRELYRMVMGRKKDGQRFATGTSELLDSEMASEGAESSVTEANYDGLANTVRTMLELLDDRERAIIEARFGIESATNKKASYSRLGEHLGISKERVRQLANRALDKLRDALPEFRLEAFLQ